jgi:hypothetical protein
MKTYHRNMVVKGDDNLAATANTAFNELRIRRAYDFLNSQAPWWRDRGAWCFWIDGNGCVNVQSYNIPLLRRGGAA